MYSMSNLEERAQLGRRLRHQIAVHLSAKHCRPYLIQHQIRSSAGKRLAPAIKYKENYSQIDQQCQNYSVATVVSDIIFLGAALDREGYRVKVQL